MKRVYLLCVTMLVAISTVNAQEIEADSTPNWKKGGSLAINFNNTSLTNWNAGGQSSIALGSIVDLYANYTKGKDNWTNNLNWAAGMARVGDNTNLIKKSDDQLILFSKYRRNIKETWGFAAFAELRTQVLKSYNFSPADLTTGANEKRLETYNSGFLSGGYLTTSIGWEYNKGENFYIHATPLAGRGTFLIDDSLSTLGLYGVEVGDKFLFELGSLVRSGWKTKVMENVDFSTTLMLFSPYSKYGNIDVTWETLTSFKINKFLTTTFATQLLYFDAVLPKIEKDELGVETGRKHGVQFKHVLNIGFLATF